jgi:spore coat protein U-like protein
MGCRTRLAIGLALFFFASLSDAGTDTSATITVSTSISAQCKIQAIPGGGSVLLGTYDPVSVNRSAPLDVNNVLNSITIACVGGSSPRVDLDNGLNVSGSQRRLKSGTSDYLNYDIYKPTGCFGAPVTWGSGATNGYTPTNPSSTADQVYTLCIRVFAGQDPPVGSYSDQVSATVNF